MRKITEACLQKMYVAERKTDLEIASVLGVGKQSVYRARKKFGIDAYKRWERNICDPTMRQIEIIYGSLLGDGHISNGKKNGKPCQSYFEEKHGLEQKDYLFWKYRELKNLCASAPKKLDHKEFGFRWRIRTFHHPFFSKLRREFYPDGTKSISKSILDKIGPLGLAVWYMDDGTICKSGNHVKFCTCSYSNEDHELLVEWMQDKFSIKTFRKDYSGYPFLVVDKNSRKDLFNIMKSDIHRSMNYKIKFREFYTWTNT